MNKFFKSIVTVILSSIAILATSAEAQQDKFAIKEGSYTANFMNEKTQLITTHGAAQIVIEKDGTGTYLQSSLIKPCYKGGLKLLQKRDTSGQLIFEVKPNSSDCPNLYYFAKIMQNGFTTHFVVLNSQGVYVRVNETIGDWVKS